MKAEGKYIFIIYFIEYFFNIFYKILELEKYLDHLIESNLETIIDEKEQYYEKMLE